MKKINQLVLLCVLALSIILPSTSNAEEWVYTTRPNDTLWDISQKYLKSVTYWERLQKHNAVDIAKNLAPGTRLRIPLEWLKTKAADATVVSVSGNVELTVSTSEEPKAITAKQSVSIGNTIITNDNSSAIIQFADGSTILIQGNSQVTFNTLSSYGNSGMVDTKLRLQQGRVESAVKPMNNSNSRYEITTPAAVAAVRGTQFRVAYEESKETMSSEVVTGAVNVAAEGVEQIVEKGFGTITEKGKAPQTPIKLLEKPDVENLPEVIKYLPFTFNWPALADAKQYRIQFSPTEQKNSLSFETIVDSEQLTLLTLNDGQYILRIRGISENNIEGFNAEHEFNLSTDFPQVTLLSPVHNYKTTAKKITFEWSADKKVVQYHLEVSTDSQFSNALIDYITNTNTATFEDTWEENHYFWRVTAIDEDNNRGKQSNINEFTVEKNKYEALLLLLYFIPALLI